MGKLTVLLDVDNTIFDREAIGPLVHGSIDANYGKGAGEKFEKMLASVREEVGWGDLEETAIRFAKDRGSSDYASVLAGFLEIPFANYFRPHAKRLIDYLAANFNLIIFSDGDDVFQKTKIEELGLFEKAREVVISKSKVNLLGELTSKYPGKVVMIDDKPANIEAAKKIVPKAVTIWIKYGRHANGYDTVDADLETDDLGEVEAYLKNLR